MVLATSSRVPTTQIRIVFDCAAKQAEESLNDSLMSGPDLMSSLVGVLTRLRRTRGISGRHQIDFPPSLSKPYRLRCFTISMGATWESASRSTTLPDVGTYLWRYVIFTSLLR